MPELKEFIDNETITHTKEMEDVEMVFEAIDEPVPSSPPKKKSKRSKLQKNLPSDDKGMAELAADLQINSFMKVKNL